MTDTPEKGSFQTDIPAEAVEDALRCVEGEAKGAEDASAPAEDAAAPEASEASEVDRLRAELELSQAIGRDTMEKLREEHDRLLRAAADLENFRKRAARERDEVQKFGNERLLKDLLPVLDNLDRALAAAGEGPVAEGVRLVRASFESALAKHGVKAFSALGAPFDPARHEALMQVPTAEQPPGTVVLEHGRGFTLSERLLRPALVGVSVALPEGEPSEAPSEDATQDGPQP